MDRRWGITEAQREHETMRICLEEVRRCQQFSPKPNFAVLLGDRYGWEPVPPVYCLYERAHDPYAFELESQLLHALRRAVGRERPLCVWHFPRP